jgi:hypothetical protein
MVLDDLILKEIRVSFLLFCLKKDAGDFSPTSKSIEPFVSSSFLEIGGLLPII